MSKFAIRIKELRTRNGWSQDTLAEKLGITRSAIGNYETGQREPDYETLETIADLFNCDMDYLTGRTDKENKLRDMLIEVYQQNDEVNKLLRNKSTLEYAIKLSNMDEETKKFIFNQIDFLCKKDKVHNNED